jgi:glutathione S-transferase
VQVELFTFHGSNAGRSIELLLDHAGLEWRRRGMRPGIHALELKLRGFAGPTAPAALIDGERVQGSVAIAHAIADAMPDLELIPSDPQVREQVLEAERLAERMQNATRRLVYVLAQLNPGQMRPLIDANYQLVPSPGRALMARTLVPVASRAKRASSSRVPQDLSIIVEALAMLDELVESRVLATDRPTVADFQATPNLAALAQAPELAEALQQRPSWRIAEAIEPDYPLKFDIHAPAAWVDTIAADQNR